MLLGVVCTLDVLVGHHKLQEHRTHGLEALEAADATVQSEMVIPT